MIIKTENQKFFHNLIKNSKSTNFENYQNNLIASPINTPLGPMISISDPNGLYFLKFVDQIDIDQEIKKLCIKTKSNLVSDKSDAALSIEKELHFYFEGKLKNFETPLHLFGSTFQRLSWNALKEIPYGETRSYSEQATMIGNPNAYRAVANANGANQIAIILPCHRIINNNGKLGGYGCGLWRKEWLLDHEKKNK